MHFQQLNRPVRYPRLPGVFLDDKKRVIVPIEHCMILPGQRYPFQISKDDQTEALGQMTLTPANRHHTIQNGIAVRLVIHFLYMISTLLLVLCVSCIAAHAPGEDVRRAESDTHQRATHRRTRSCLSAVFQNTSGASRKYCHCNIALNHSSPPVTGISRATSSSRRWVYEVG